MPYERFYEVLEEFQRLMKSGAADPDALEQCSAELFDSLFDHFPWGPGMRGFREEYNIIWEDIKRRILENPEEDAVEQITSDDETQDGNEKLSVRIPRTPFSLPEHIATKIHEAMRKAMIKKSKGYQAVHIGSFQYLTGRPNPLPSDDMLRSLKQLTLPDVTYQPDQEGSPAELAIAINVKGAILFVTWLLYDYGDDIQPTHSELENLLARYDRARYIDNEEDSEYVSQDDEGEDSASSPYGGGEDSESGSYGEDSESGSYSGGEDSKQIHSVVRSLSKRIAAELAFQQRDYAAALTEITKSIAIPRRYSERRYLEGIQDGHYEGNSESPITPWLFDAENLAMDCIANIEQATGVNADWPAVADACELLSKCSFDHDDYQYISTVDRDIDTIGGTDYEFWLEKSGWARAQVTPDRLRALLRDQDDELAAQRLRTYFFSDGLWEKLSKRAQSALITADRMMTSAIYARYSGIANEIRIATEEVFYYNLWEPLDEWADKNRSDSTRLRFVLDEPQQSRRSPNPSISDYITLLEHSDIKAYFRSLGLSDNNVRFLTKDKRTVKNLKTLRDLRNKAEHNPNPAVGPDRIRAIYAQFLGIGRQGVLPELLRLLTAAPRDAS